MKKALHWFSNDLRLEDNSTLSALIEKADCIAFVYVIDPRDFKPNNYHHQPIGKHRWRLISDSLRQLDKQLQNKGHQLTILHGHPEMLITKLVTSHHIDLLGYNKPVGLHERQRWQTVQQAVAYTECISESDNTLFTEAQLSLEEKHFTSFSQFRKRVEKMAIEPFLARPLTTLPACLELAENETTSIAWQALSPISDNGHIFSGGELTAKAHLKQYFSGALPSSYKQTRNALSGWHNSTKMSHFLALGNLSARQIWQQLKHYEKQIQKNDSTYWIGFELLWREYFQYLALKLKAQLFAFKGNASTAPMTSFFAERFQKWCQGNTPFALVNACMHELNATGYISNRGRQIVASCLVNELGIDWRFGAAYFQQQLVDYDVATNWGNWQYIAGVGADPRGGRHFNIEKQTAQFDPHKAFITQWQGEVRQSELDSIDITDWPI
ncbi:DASH family cryptochrome [Psychromonas sp. psych-6C06]|uniref:DASH family cryptochrome n=1 Tax=Psychromonas sp. psych-6C06 TaxID=2058089 RepID=UPI000C32B288|nr:DASH family cryptochrome [Psychromonas sp. psych-6C06]PKF62014.1 DASH family cryptochrome [Psychromonas sp. psych-6C06]